ncbi:hypothetical protein I5907_06545 [Panacibacter sp. DH6]|uniref:Lipoprotein n=1 Tax=Panacibacter microcysteis TaxID=2793269 RepID=A0A931E1R0_9BACT|nr:hypothetical protein [Panacibacter microcysteis]MBG9375885.1 hypothetical protein [Panacibacter microcysteis]
MRYLFFTLCLCTVFSSCRKTISETSASAGESPAENEFLMAKKSKTYVIYKGNQSCTPNPFVLTSAAKMAFTAIFDSTCTYQTVSPGNQEDINKLYGFSDCGSHHLDNSARIGWRWSDDSLRLFGFVHNDGVMVFREITTASIGSTVTCRINCLAETYYFEVNGKSVSLPRHCSGKYSRYKLFPYFGGDETAPHDIKIIIQEIPY